MTIAHETNQAQTPPGWKLVVLKGGPYDGHRFNLHESEDRLTLYVGIVSHCYYATNSRDVLHHESIVAGAFGGRVKR